MRGFSNDLRFAVRVLTRAPGFSLFVVLSLSLGIGANTAIFSVVNAVLLEPLPYPDPGRIVMVWQDLRARGGPPDEWATPGNFFDWQAESGAFDHLAAVANWQTSIGTGDAVEPVAGAAVTGGYFDVLGVEPLAGRGFVPEEDRPGAPRAVVLGYGLWMRHFGGDPSVVGRLVHFAGEPHVVVGVMPRTFKPAVIPTAEAWRPMRLDPAKPSRGAIVLRVVGRLRGDLTVDQARARLDALALRLGERYPDTNRGAGIAIVPLREQLVKTVRLPLLVLLGAVGFVLLIACANIASLLLARASARRREVSLKVALGAARPRLVRQFLAESFLYAAAGGVLGLLVARWGVDLLLALVPAGRLPVDGVELSWPVLLFSAGVTLGAALLSGLAPALQASATDAVSGLKEGRAASSLRSARLRPPLVAGQVAVTLVLLVGAGLLARSFARLQAVDLGFDPADTLAAEVVPPASRYREPEAMTAFYDRLLESVSAIPGIEAAALSSVLPLPGGDSNVSLEIEGRPAPSGPADEPAAWYRLVSSRYFDAVRMKLVSGRGFAASEPSPGVVVNETMARKYWPGQSPIGRRLRAGPKQPWFTVVGVVKDARTRGPAATPQVEMFAPYTFIAERGTNVVLRSSKDPAALEAALRRAVRRVDPEVPVRSVTTLDAAVSQAVAQPRFLAAVLGAFALASLALAAIGVYGVVSYTVAARTPEIGVRMALGADPSQIRRQVLAGGLKLAAAGAAVGAAAALAVVRLISSLLFDVRPTDPVVFAATTALLTLVVLAAGCVPAHRAAAIDPLAALRVE
ncbi:MAG: ABC transporter permease [Vicinamibacterales bacterium]